MKSHPDIHVGLGGERIGRKGTSKLFSDFVVVAPVPPQDRVLARPVLAFLVLGAVAPLVAQVVNLCGFLGYLPLGAAHARRRTLATPLQGFARSMLPSLSPSWRRSASNAGSRARAAPRWPPVAQVFNLCVLQLEDAVTEGA